MKKLILALCICFISNLAANEELCPPPKPPCCPTPPEPICCQCFVPNYYDLQCNSRVFAYGDFLFWYANEDNLSPCMTVQGNGSVLITNPNNNIFLNPIKANHLHTAWDPGFRVGVGYNFKHDGWDLELNYTWYQNKKKRLFNVPGFGLSTGFPFFPNAGQLALVDPWINTTIFDPLLQQFLFDTVNTRWKLTFNQFDLELGRKFSLSRFMAMRAYAGIRGAWFTTRFNNAASNNSNLSPTYTFTKFSDNFKDRVWGVGMLAGIQPEWHFCKNFLLFSNLDASLLWGRFKVRKKEDYSSYSAAGPQTLNYQNIFTNTFYKMQAVLDLALGFRWEETWCYRIRTALDVAWENHIWFDENHRVKILDASRFNSTSPHISEFQSYDELQGNLMMGGLVIGFRVDF